MTPFLILSATTSALLMVMAALMDRRSIRSGPIRTGRDRRALRAATPMSTVMTVPVAGVIWVAGGPVVALCLAAVLWHLAGWLLLSRWTLSLSLRRAADVAKKA